jgi:hypothetical protein
MRIIRCETMDFYNSVWLSIRPLIFFIFVIVHNKNLCSNIQAYFSKFTCLKTSNNSLSQGHSRDGRSEQVTHCNACRRFVTVLARRWSTGPHCEPFNPGHILPSTLTFYNRCLPSTVSARYIIVISYYLIPFKYPLLSSYLI